MKYHFQLVSRTAVRIELIPEHQTEKSLLDQFIDAKEQDEQLLVLFSKGIAAYHNGATLTKIKFMNFPKVALCSYQLDHKNLDLNYQNQTEILF